MKNSKNEPLASIIITNYNKSSFLKYSVKSCIEQKYKKKEIIFFDDKSTDNSLIKIKELNKKTKQKIKIISNPNKKKNFPTLSHIEAIKKGLKKTKGKYVFLLDSDDYFHKNKIKKIIEIFNKNEKIQFVLNNPILKYKKKEIKKKFESNLTKNKWPKFPPTSCMCFEKKTLTNVLKKIYPKKFPNLAIDFRLAVYYSLILKKFYIHQSYLTFYRQVEDGMDSKYNKYKSKEWWIRRNEAFEFLNLLLKKNNLPPNRSIDFFVTRLLNNLL
jgi:glycosyltransferase involved in cell wall biosynthesis